MGAWEQQKLPSLPASLSASVAVTILCMMAVCFLIGEDEGVVIMDLRNKVCLLLQMASQGLKFLRN